MIISSFVALSLSPMMCSRLLRRRETEPLLARPVKAFLDWLDRIYTGSPALVAQEQGAW